MSTVRSISPGRVTADFFTGSYRLSATVLVYRRRLVDVLADKSTDYLELVDIYISRINSPGDIVATYQKGALVKEEINFIVLASEEEATSQQRFYTSNRVHIPIFITVPSFEINGKFQWMGKIEFRKILAIDNQKFLPVLEVSASNSLFPKVTFQGPIVLVNKTKIEVLCLGEAT